jgi:penicillin-binding protein 2
MKFDISSAVYRIIIIGIILLVGYLVLIFNLWDEQIRRGDSHQEKLSRQSGRRIREPALRGKIFSSDMQLLADNVPAFDLYFYLEEMRQSTRQKTIDNVITIAKYLAGEIRRPAIITREMIIRHINLRPGLPFPVFKDLSREEMAVLHELSANFKGVGIELRTSRLYPEGSAAAHIIGFTRHEDPGSAEDREEYSYYIPDLVGKCGAEKRYDSFDEINSPGVRGMRGIPGCKLVQVDHRGYVYKTLDEIKPLDGNNIILTIDFKAQKIAESVMRGYRGAAVLLDADSGAIIAMASAPSFDLKNFSPRLSVEYLRNLYSDPGNPMLNRATEGSYTPGSIIKPLIAMAILNSGVSPNKQVECDGATTIGNAKIHCANTSGHGALTLTGAIEHSCNDYFIENGLIAGLDNIVDVMKSAGIGSPTGFGLSEKRGIIPSSALKEKIFQQRWNKYDTALLSIGQGIINITPVQAANYCAAIANGGKLYQPYILKEIRDQFGNIMFATQPRIMHQLKVSDEHLNIIREGMRLVVQSNQGSGKNARNEIIQLYGKTGTAEIGSGKNKRKNTWFICFGTFLKRTYAMAILVENGESGGRTCAPLASRFFERYLGNMPIPETEEPLAPGPDHSDDE